MAHCPYCGNAIAAGTRRCAQCGDLSAELADRPDNDTAPAVPTYDALVELRRTQRRPVPARRAVQEEPTRPLPEHIRRALDESPKATEKPTVVARPPAVRQLGVTTPGRARLEPGPLRPQDTIPEPRPKPAPGQSSPFSRSDPHDTLSEPGLAGARPELDLHDTLSEPGLPGPGRQGAVEPAQSLRATIIDTSRSAPVVAPGPSGAYEAIVDAPPPEEDHESVPEIFTSADLQDTLINVRAMRERSGQAQGGGRLDPFTFSDVGGESTGAAPLEPSHFRRPEYDPTLPAPIRLPSLELDEADRPRADSTGSEVPLGSGERPVPAAEAVVVVTRDAGRGGGLAWLNRLLCLLTALLWLALGLLAVGPHLVVEIPLLPEIWRWLPIVDESLPLLPGGLTLFCLLTAAVVRRRYDAPTRAGSTAGTFFKLLLCFLLAWLPGPGVLLGLVIGLVWLFGRRRGTVAAALLLLASTLGWQAALTIYVRYGWPWQQIVGYLPKTLLELVP